MLTRDCPSSSSRHIGDQCHRPTDRPRLGDGEHGPVPVAGHRSQRPRSRSIMVPNRHTTDKTDRGIFRRSIPIHSRAGTDLQLSRDYVLDLQDSCCL